MISHGSALMAILKNVPMLQIMITVMSADCLRRKKMNELDMSKEYSTRFDELRRNRVEVSYYKYGSAYRNFGRGNVQAIPTLEKCLQKYKETGNGDYLCDIANYAMFEFMYPQHPKAHFRATDSSESAGIVGMSVNEMERFKNGE